MHAMPQLQTMVIQCLIQITKVGDTGGTPKVGYVGQNSQRFTVKQIKNMLSVMLYNAAHHADILIKPDGHPVIGEHMIKEKEWQSVIQLRWHVYTCLVFLLQRHNS